MAQLTGQRDDPAGESMRHGGTGKVYGWPEIKKQGVSSLIHWFIYRVGVSAVRNIKATQQTDHHYHLGYDKAIITKA